MIRGLFRRRARLGLLLIGVAGLGSVAAAAVGASAPERPRRSVETREVAPSGRTIAVAASGDVQAALDRAQPGDTITLEAGAVFTGPFRLPSKSGDGWIVVRTSAPDGTLPPPGTRVGPSNAAAMPKLVAASGSVLATAPGAHHYRFVGLEIRPRDGVALTNLVELGRGETSIERLPHDLIFERCYVHGDPAKGTRRGIALNSRSTAVIDSYLSDFKERGADSQAIAGWNGDGPFTIVNNYLEGAGENVLFGGADPAIPDLVPADIEIRRNHIAKPLRWKQGEPGYEGTPWSVKNLLELKNARRVVIEGNILEGNWAQAQNGFAILFTARNQDGRAPWSVVEDVTFANNVVRHAGAGISMLGRDNNFPSQQTRRILISNNLFEDIGGARWGGGGTLFQIINGTANVVIEHNTAFQTGNIITTEGAPNEGFVYRQNLTPHNEYGITGSGTGTGGATFDRFFPRAVIEKNVMAGGSAAQYPRGNFFPRSLDAVGFVDRARGDYRLADASRYRRGGGAGEAPGVDFDALRAATAAEDRRAAQR
jgi:hypothetical protein